MATTIMELRDEAGRLFKQANDLVAGDSFNTEEVRSQVDALIKQAAALNARADKMKEIAESQNRIAEVYEQEALDAKAARYNYKPAPKAFVAERGDSSRESRDEVRNRVNREFQDWAVRGELSDRFGEGSDRNQIEITLPQRRATIVSTGTGAQSINDELPTTIGEVIEALRTSTTLERAGARIVNTSDTNTYLFPIITPIARESDVDDIVAGENVDATDRDVAFSNVPLYGHRIPTSMEVSKQAVMDASFDLEGVVLRQMMEYDAESRELLEMLGNGGEGATTRQQQPRGLTNAVTAEAAGSDLLLAAGASDLNDVDYEAFTNILTAIESPYRMNGVWIMNSKTMAAVMRINNAGQGLLWQQNMRTGPEGTIFGRPVFISEAVPSAGGGASDNGNKFLFFGDPRYFIIRNIMMATIAVDRDSAPMLKGNKMAFVLNGYMDCTMASVPDPVNNSNRFRPFVCMSQAS